MNRNLCLMLLAAVSALAQPGSFQGPGLGFVHDPVERSVRPVIGFPGSAYVGAAVLDQVGAATVASNRIAALIVREGTLWAVPDLRQPWNTIMLQSESAPWDQAAWSADSRIAALYRVDTGQLSIVRDIDTAPVLDAPIDLSTLPRTVTALAINKDGSQVFAGISDESAGGLYLLARGQEPLQLAAGKNFTSAAFDASGQKLFAADRDARTIWEVANADTIPVAAVFAAASDGVGDTIGVAVATGGTRLILANRDDRSVQLFDLSSRSVVETLALETAPATLSHLGGGIFLLNPRTAPESPLFILETGSPAAVYFVPAGTLQ